PDDPGNPDQRSATRPGLRAAAGRDFRGRQPGGRCPVRLSRSPDSPDMIAARTLAPPTGASAATKPSRARAFNLVRRMRLAAVGLCVLVLAIMAALLAPWVAPHDPAAVVLVDRLQPPLSPGHLLGTDGLGQDVLSRVIFGARVSVLVGFSAVAISGFRGVS